MGEIGMVTRILANRVGSPFTYATYSRDKKMAPGQLNWKEMTELYDYKSIDTDTELFGVIADPVAHSYSPMIHNRAFQSEGLNACYLPFRVPSDDLNQFMLNCYAFGVRGISVTIPHKERAMTYCTQAESSADRDRRDQHDGLSRQRNTGIQHRLSGRDGLASHRRSSSTKKPTSRCRECVRWCWGAGGVSRAIAWGLRQRGAEVYISSRTVDRAELLSSQIGCRVVRWEDPA